ncbi:unnamed protein product [Oppiella nova]|uniref:Sulfotransferase domain-containing protein n=1 Tax=Oppiella nova TaxID=334625 RepID=A0A7R9QHY2_9ACAR|nr:unnamed protein product [Oppiella nova]CAG2166188.1 unnamed protein product [Oppiella nova]
MYAIKVFSHCPGFCNKKSKKSKSEIILAANEPDLDADPQRAQYVRSIPNALLFDNLLLQGYLVNQNFLSKIYKFNVREDDLWLATYPKSGTTWTEEILSLIYNGGDIEKVKDKLLPKRVKHFEVGIPVGHSRWLQSKKSQRLIATHLPTTHIPIQLQQLKCKIIYVVRNPKDTAVSYYHHHRMSKFLGNYAGTWDNFVDLFAQGKLVHGDWLSHVEGYWRLHQQNPNQVLFISYEELKTDLPKMIAVIARFVGNNLTDEIIERIANHCSFDEMKDNKMVNREKLPVKGLFDMSQSKFMRKGIIGDWRTHFSDEQSKLFDKAYNHRLQELGINLCYDSDEAVQLAIMFALNIIWNIRNIRETKLFRKFSQKRSSDIHIAAHDPELDTDPQRAQYVRSIPNAWRFDDILLQGYLVFPNFLGKIKNFQVREDDIWLATYPKSGTTWTEEILSLIANGGDIEKVKETVLPKRVKHFEVGLPVGHSRWLKSKKSQRLIATHLPTTHIPRQLRQMKCKIIYVVRNPKDAAVSYYYHHRMSSFLGNYKGSWDDFCKLFVSGQLVYGDWLSHVEGFWRLHQHNPNQVLFLSYEELKTDLPKMVALIANFLGKDLSDEVIARIATHCSFECMKDNKMVNRESILLKGVFDMKDSKFMRQGVIGGWKHMFTDAQSQLFDDTYADKLDKLGLHICYDNEDALAYMQTNRRNIEQGGN